MNIQKQPSHEEVRQHLGYILASGDLKNSPLLCAFLEYIVEETLAGRGERLKAYSIGVEVFGRNEDFDPMLDSSIRVAAGKLRSKLDHYYYSGPGRSDQVVISIPKGSYAPQFRYADNSFSVKHPVELNRRHSERELAEQTIEEFNRVVAPVNGSSLPCAIAIVPFSAAGSEECELIAEAICEEISMELSHYDQLSILGGQSLKHLKGRTQDFNEIALLLGARFVLHGSVQVANSNVRVRVSLTEAGTKKQLWAEKLDCRLAQEDIFAIQDEISSQVVSRLAGTFGCITRTLEKEIDLSDIESLSAYDLPVLYNQWIRTLDLDLFKMLLKRLEVEVEQNPEYATAHALFSELCVTDHMECYDIIPRPLERADEHSAEAVRLDMHSQWGHTARAMYMMAINNTDGFLLHVEWAIKLNPTNSYPLITLGASMAMMGFWERGTALLNKGLQLNPWAPCWCRLALCLQKYLRGDYEAALVDALEPGFGSYPWAIVMRIACYGRLGLCQEASLQIDLLRAKAPAFIKNHKRLIPLVLYLDNQIEAVREGLRLAGLDLADETSRA